MINIFKRNKNKKEQLEDEYNKLKSKYDGLEEKYNIEQEKVKSLNNTIIEMEKRENKNKEKINTNSLEYIDTLNGLEFEQYTKKLLQKLGYKNVEVTKASGDYGIDILAEKDFVTYAIQCKLYSTTLGNDCVQEAYSGKEYYGKNIAVVLTNSTFSPAAIQLAKKVNVLLWDRNILYKMLKQVDAEYIECDKYIKSSSYSNDKKYDDPLYNEIVDFVIETQKASASLLQRRFKIGYNRAAMLIDMLEEQGIIGPQNGSNPREVLILKDVNE